MHEGTAPPNSPWLFLFRKPDVPVPRLRHLSHPSRFQSLAPVVDGDRVAVVKVLLRTPVAVVIHVHDAVIVEHFCRITGRSREET